jgi:hypothetical protein
MALCWDLTGKVKTITLFLDGKNVCTQIDNKKDWDTAQKNWDGLDYNDDMLIGIGKYSNGEAEYKNTGNPIRRGVASNFEITQFRISDTMKYDSEFTPKDKLVSDKDTLIYLSLEDDTDGTYYKNGKKVGKITCKQVKIGSGKR